MRIAVRHMVLVACAVVLAAGIGAAQASAKETFVPALGSASFSQPGAIASPTGVAVDPETGNVYVVSKSSKAVEIFGAEGGSPAGGVPTLIAGTEGISPKGVAIDASCWYHEPKLTGSACESYDPANGNVYVAGLRGVIDEFQLNRLSGEYELAQEITEGGEPEGVAVDHDGHVYVAKYESEAISVYDSSGAKVGQIAQSVVGEPGYIAVGAPGVVYVGNYGGGVAKLEVGPAYEVTHEKQLGIIETQKSSALAVGSNGNVYVDERFHVTVYNPAGELIGEFAQAIGRSEGLAVDDATGDVYVSSGNGNDLLVYASAIVPDVTSGPVQAFTTTTAKLTGTVGPVGTTVTSCEFEYGTEPGVFAGKANCVPATPYSGEEPVMVTGTATGLTGGETYYYRLTASNAEGADHSAEGSFLQPKPVVVEAESTSFVEAKAATLEATINPGGAETTYRFEVGSAAGSYDVTVPGVGGPTRPSLSALTVLGRVRGLSEGTTYHFRVVAENTLPGQVDGADASFTTLTPAGSGESCPNARLREEQPYAEGLPDCRAYEMVSPLEKSDSSVLLNGARAAVAGAAVTYDSNGSFGEAAGAQLDNRYLSRRTPAGWSTQNITPPFTPGGIEPLTPFTELLFTPELTKGVIQSKETPLTDTPKGFTNLYVANFEAGSYELLTPRPPGVRPYENYAPAPFVAGTSTDLSRVFFEDRAALTPEALSGYGEKLYETTEGHTYLVGIEPDGQPFSGETETQLGHYVGEYDVAEAWHAVSEDGKRVFFTAEGQIYLRENPEAPQSPLNGNLECTVAADACTIEVSASQRGAEDPHGPQPARFWAASAQGTKVFFTSNTELTEDANTGAEDNAANLYEYDVEDGKLTDLTIDAADAEGAAVLGVAGAGEDGSYLYFVAQGALTDTANQEGVKPAGPSTVSGTFAGGSGTGNFVNPYSNGQQVTEVKMTSGSCSVGDKLVGVPSWFVNTTVTAVNESAHTITLEGPYYQKGVKEFSCNSPEVTGVSGDFFVGEEVVGAGVEPGTTIAGVGAGTVTLSPAAQLLGSQTFTVEAPNLYVYHDGTIRFIASLAHQDERVWRAAPVESRARVSADGTHIAFPSARALAGADNEEAAPGECSNIYEEIAGDCEEVYLYDASSGELACPSCAPSGAPPVGPSWLGGRGEDVPEVDLVAYATFKTYYAQRNLSEDGGRLFFQSPNALAQDGGSGRVNVYEYEHGHAYPISNVAGERDSYFMDASPSGNDVFIGTANKLVGQDRDSLADVYDARVDGGFPAPAGSTEGCGTAETCKAAGGLHAQSAGAPASATFSGPGNLTPKASGRQGEANKGSKLTRRQKLRRALARCTRHYRRSARKRHRCKQRARKRYSAKAARNPSRQSPKRSRAARRRAISDKHNGKGGK